MSAPSRRGAVSNLRKSRALRPVNGTIRDGSDAVITRGIAGPSHPRSALLEVRLASELKPQIDVRVDLFAQTV